MKNLRYLGQTQFRATNPPKVSVHNLEPKLFTLETLCRISKSYLLRSYESAIECGKLPPSTDPHQLIHQRLGQPIHIAPYKNGKRVLLGYLDKNNVIGRACKSRLGIDEQSTQPLQYVLGIEEIQEARYKILFNLQGQSPGTNSILKILSHAERVIRLNKSLIFYSQTTWQDSGPTILTGITSKA
jgi:hypothetical protein